MAKKKISRVVSQGFKAHGAVNRALRYAEEVDAGKISAGLYTRLACKRQLTELKKKRFAYYFDPVEAERVVSIVELLPHTKGKWAGKPIKLEPWQLFILTALFGWRSKKDNLRRYREAYVAVPRKNGKSIIAAAIGLLMLGFDGENGAEVYCGATTEKQALEVFKPARKMVQQTPELRDEIGIHPYANSLTIEGDGSVFQRIVGTPGDGQSPSCGIIDEYHEHQSTEQYDTMASGMLAREQPLLAVITTAGSNYGGPCYTHQTDCQKVLEGVIPNDRLFVIIYHADIDDDWSKSAAIEKANPNLGVSVMRDTLLAMQEAAKASPQKQNTFRTKHLNQWVSAKSAWLNMLKWKRCGNQRLKIDDYKARDCIIGIDLASKSDLAAVVRTFWREDEKGNTHYVKFPRFYLPGDALLEDKTGNYARWLKLGLLTITDGNEIDYETIENDILKDMETYNVLEAVYDPFHATQLAQRLTKAGATMVEYRNTVQNMSEPMKELEAAVNGRRLHHDHNEVFTWNASNVVAKLDAKDNIFPRKEKPQFKIDGIVASIMTIGRLMYREPEENIDDFINGMVSG